MLFITNKEINDCLQRTLELQNLEDNKNWYVADYAIQVDMDWGVPSMIIKLQSGEKDIKKIMVSFFEVNHRKGLKTNG